MKKKFKLMFADYILFWQLLPVTKKKQSYKILILVVLASFLEVMGVGMVMPVLIVITDAELINGQTEIALFLNDLGIKTQNSLLTITMLLFISIYVIKNTFAGWLSFVLAEFVFSIKSFAATMLHQRYLFSSYEFHLTRNSNELQKNILREPLVLAQNIVTPLVILITEVLVVLMIILLLLVLQPGGSIFTFFVFLVGMSLFQKVSSSYTGAWGAIRLKSETSMVKSLSNSLGGIKLVMLTGAERFFLRQSELGIKKVAEVEGLFQGIAGVPRIWLETLGVITIFSWAFILMSMGATSDDLLAAIGIFAAAAFRLLPSTNKILTAFQSLSYGREALRLLYGDLKDTPRTTSGSNTQDEGSVKFSREILLKDVSYSYPGTDRNALGNINIKLKKGSTTGITGQSGVGKSTVLDIILGLLSPSHGAVLVDGRNIASNIKSWQAQIGYVQQNVFLTDDSLKMNIAFGFDEDEVSIDQVHKVLTAASLSGFVEALPFGIETPMGERGENLSGGQKQRIGIARALYRNPDILIFDEATSALDYDTEKEIMGVIRELKEQGKTILIIAHRLSTLNFCDQIFELEKDGFSLM